MEIIPYGRQNIDQEDIDAVVDVLRSDWLTQGPMIKEFEEMVAKYHNCKYAVAFSNGTAALHGAYYVSTKFPFGKNGKIIEDLNEFLKVKNISKTEYEKFKNQYWEFITTPITFVASANGGRYCGGSAKFVDIDLNTYCIDIENIEDAISEDTRVITPVSYAGYPVDIKSIKNLPKVKENNICIIHDACHAIGARREECGIADYADMTILSFHPVKHITTGEGGMVLTNNRAYYDKLLLFRNHGITKDATKLFNESEGGWHYEMQELGYNYRITDIQCALGISQMKKLDKFLFKRNQIAELYENELKNIEFFYVAPGFDKSWLDIEKYIDLREKPSNLHSYHLFPLILDQGIDRKDFFDYMWDNGIKVQVHYKPVDTQPVYMIHNENKLSSTKNSRYFYQREISLPMYPSISDEQLEKTIKTIREYKNKIKKL